MAKNFITVRRPNFSGFKEEARRFKKAQERAALEATHLASQRAQKHIQAKMKSVGLGRLSNAVGHTSAKLKRQEDRTPYGVIFAKGGDESSAGGALEAYSQGATIRAKNGEWLAYATDAVPRLVGGRRMNPKRYLSNGFTSSIGKLIFRRIKPDLALLVVRNVSLSPKTGRAKALGKGKPRSRVVPDKDTVVFVLIKQTRRAKRFDKDQILRIYSNRVPDYLARIMKQIYR